MGGTILVSREMWILQYWRIARETVTLYQDIRILCDMAHTCIPPREREIELSQNFRIPRAEEPIWYTECEYDHENWTMLQPSESRKPPPEH